MTDKSLTNLIGSTTSITEHFPQDKTVYRTNETNKIVNTIKERTTGKINNTKKNIFTVPTIKTLISQIDQLEVEKAQIITTWKPLNS